MNKNNLLKGGKTKTGKQTYLFYNKNHKIVEVLPETAEKNGYKPVLKNHDDDKLKEIELKNDKKNYLKNKLKSELSKKDDMSELEKIQKQEIDRIKKKKENKKDKPDNLDKLENLEKKYSNSQEEKEKMKELLDKKEKADKRHKDFNDKIQKDLEIEKKKKEEKERLRKNKEEIQSKIIKTEKTDESKKNINVKKLKKDSTPPPQEKPKKPTVQDKLDLKSKENFIMKQLFDNPIAKILADYINKNSGFEIFHNDKLIYNSNNTSKDQIVLKQDYFEIFDRKYPYTGLRFKKL